MHHGHLSPQAQARVAHEFCVRCLVKPKPSVCDGGDTTAAVLPEPPSASSQPGQLTYLDVVQALHDDVEWSSTPYPPCTRAQLLQVHSYWVAVPKAAAASCAGATAAADIETASAATAEGTAEGPSFACVVGVVWVRLSTAVSVASRHAPRPAVEGYIQVVLTHPSHRRRGLASWLLTQCLACTEAPASVFASDRCGAAAYRIQRWHLHTLAAVRLPAKRPRRDDGVANAAASASRDGDAAIAATISLYQRLGFHERRHLARYYAGKDDAVELVKTCR
ncbi:hypothetical protein NESM_000338700 [Novymonas esmeraldas]|uniref:N-acetyltransferase domain-containing protein n=1 Tax=Novymonas esmeraldas TaxID=1808958 RepID=A0AAW0ELG7_9TRYP